MSEKQVAGEKKEQTIPELRNWVMDYVSVHTAGSPTDSDVKWTHLQPRDIAGYLLKSKGVVVSNSQVKRILRAEGYRRRKPAKILPTGQSPHREEQFRVIIFLLALFSQMDNNPVVSTDTKKKEALGQLTRGQALLCKDGKPVEVYDHDYSYLSTGKAIPHGIYDLKLNKGYITIGNSHETAAFVVDNLRWWWLEFGIHHYPDASTILLLCDSGGANGYRHHLFKKLLLELASEIGLRIIVAHYPPYCSKYNPIERKLFCHVERAIKGNILTELKQVKELMDKTCTDTGLSVVVRIVDKIYPTGLVSRKQDLDQKRILRHPVLPELSYTILP